MDVSRQSIRLEIEGRWLAEAMGNLLLAIPQLYELGYTEIEVRRLVSQVDDKQQFLIKAIDDDKLRRVSDFNAPGQD
jgi:hypothetical protein